MVDRDSHLPHRRGDAAISIAPFMAIVNVLDRRFCVRVLIFGMRGLLVIVKGAARNPGHLQQTRDRILLPQPINYLRFLFGADNLFVWIKASSFFRYAFSIRK